MKTLISACVLAVSVVAQTTNTVAFNELLLNGFGGGQTSAINQTFQVGQGINTQWSGLANSPIILAIDSICAPGTAVLGVNNTLDLPVSGGFQIVLDGTGTLIPGWFAQFLHLDASGNMQFNIPNAPGVPGGLNFGVQGAMLNAGYSPGGLQLTAAFNIYTPVPPVLGPSNTTCNPLAVNTGIACDDCFVTMPLGFAWSYYGTAYTQAHVGSNGYVCFGTGDSTYYETVAWFLQGPARVAACFDDHLPAFSGTITFYTDNASTWEVCFTNVDEYYGLGPNTHKTTAIPGGILFDYHAAMTINDCIVGLSPGSNIDPAGTPLNIGAGSNVLPGTAIAPYQIFDGYTTFLNLKGYQVVWGLTPAGFPVSQN